MAQLLFFRGCAIFSVGGMQMGINFWTQKFSGNKQKEISLKFDKCNECIKKMENYINGNNYELLSKECVVARAC